MDDDQQGRKRWRKRLRPILALVVFLLLMFIVPPLVSINRYRSQITRLISESLGRPVRLSSVELRVFPRPGFEITDLSVAEDPAYGVEPVLHANSVSASIRLLSLWRGRLEIGAISVDEASLNIVHTGPGKWNLDPLFRTAAAKAGSTATGSRPTVPLPYLEATESRINFKEGAEKLPFSLVNAKFELWQENPGDWRVRLRGQPARTDLSLFQEDTGEVNLEASVHHAPTLLQMPVQLDLEWRDAQLGQLSRLVFGADPGWRGNLTGNLHLEGTAVSARLITRLRAEGVHRAEFTPAEALDFDANCNLVYHFELLTFENLACSSPIGEGRVQLTGDRPRGDAAAHLTAELDQVPVAAGLGILRTLRSGLAPDLQATGKVSGKIDYDASVPPAVEPVKASWSKRTHPAKPSAATGPLKGSLTVEGFTLSGGGLSQPMQLPKIVLEPVLPQSPGGRLAIAGSASVPLGGALPMTVDLSLTLAGYTAEFRGPASIGRARDMIHAVGLAHAAPQVLLLEGIAGDPLTIDLQASGPWLAQEQVAQPPSVPAQLPAETQNPAQPPTKPAKTPAPQPAAAILPADTLTGTVTLRNVNWRADYLASHVEITQATLTITDGGLLWDPVDFSYGPLKGTATLELKTACAPGEACPPHFTVQFGALDAADLETTLLGVQQKGSLLSSLIDRLHPSSAPPWPEFEGTLKADSLILGPVTLAAPSADLRIAGTGAQISSLTAGLLGGRLDASGSFARPASDQDKPAYSFEGKLENLSPAAVGHLLGLHFGGGAFNAGGKLDLAGYTGKDLSASATGTLHFDWARGAVSGKPESGKAHTAALPATLARFDRWSGVAAIASGVVTLGENQVELGRHKDSVSGSVTLADTPVVSFATPNIATPKTVAPKTDVSRR